MSIICIARVRAIVIADEEELDSEVLNMTTSLLDSCVDYPSLHNLRLLLVLSSENNEHD